MSNTNSLGKTLVLVLGVVFLLVGVLGFFMNPVLGLFEVDLSHNLVHVLSGVLLVGGALMSARYAKYAALLVGVVYGLVTLLGFLTLGSNESVELLGVLHVNANDNWLHLVLTVALLAVGLYTKDDAAPMM